MASIGPYAVTTWKGYLTDCFRRGAVIPPPAGADAVAVSRSGWSPTSQHIITVNDNSASLLTVSGMYLLINAFRQLPVNPTIVVDQFGASWAVTVLKASPRPDGYNIATGCYRVLCDWILLPDVLTN